jgi:anti-sigma factor RsiW
MSTPTLTCQELVELVTDYLEDALPNPERQRFEAHLRACRGCANYFSQIRQTIQMAGRLTEEALEPTAKQELLDLFKHWKENSPAE